MPNVLLIGGSQALYEKLKSDSRWNLVRVIHEKRKSGTESILGDPRNWDLVIDDCAHSAIAAREADALVSDDYLSEATRARGLLFGAGNHDSWFVSSPAGHHAFEANPTRADDAIHLVDFFDEFEATFVNQILRTNYVDSSRLPVALFENSYRHSLAVLDMSYRLSKRLILIDVADDETRQKAFEYLLYQPVPKLWPEIFSDQFRPRRVVELEDLREREVVDRRVRVQEIDASIDEELAFTRRTRP